MKRKILRLNESQLKNIITESVKKVLNEWQKDADAAREEARRKGHDPAKKMKFAQAVSNKTGGRIRGFNADNGKRFGFEVMTPNNTSVRFSDDDPHGSEFNTEFKTMPNFIKMSPEEKERYRRETELSNQAIQDLRNYYKKSR